MIRLNAVSSTRWVWSGERMSYKDRQDSSHALPCDYGNKIHYIYKNHSTLADTGYISQIHT